MTNYYIVILSLAADQAFENQMLGRPVPACAPAGGWERIWRNCEELLYLDAPVHDQPQPSDQWCQNYDAEFDDVPF